jgi:hypothetical protein
MNHVDLRVLGIPEIDVLVLFRYWHVSVSLKGAALG